MMMTDYIAVEDLSGDMAKDELTRLADLLNRANNAYHGDDSPIMTDAEFDFLKKRNLEIDLSFPNIRNQIAQQKKLDLYLQKNFQRSSMQKKCFH